eukprot:GFYU01013841.1.p1 GENE.GFYU01013841.1~~GFYU01013841.1.p1  ORF type:complete len:302 (-),score=13.58 GFYU01013841.1:666-1571(-)
MLSTRVVSAWHAGLAMHARGVHPKGIRAGERVVSSFRSLHACTYTHTYTSGHVHTRTYASTSLAGPAGGRVLSVGERTYTAHAPTVHRLVGQRNNNAVSSMSRDAWILNGNGCHPVSVASTRVRAYATDSDKDSEQNKSTQQQTDANDIRPPPQPHEDEPIPRPALVAGVVSVIPMVVCSVAPLALHYGYGPLLIGSQLCYSASMLSCLSTVQFGALIASKEEISWSKVLLTAVSPTTAWVAMNVPPSYSVATLMLGYTAALVIDLEVVKTGLLPEWYARLRTPLTIITTLALGGTWCYLD